MLLNEPVADIESAALEDNASTIKLRCRSVRYGVGRPKISGGYIEEAIPDPISNSEVKLLGADGTARATVWESRTLPG